jgi:hypothetical protein
MDSGNPPASEDAQMPIHITEPIQNDPELERFVEIGNEQLRDVLGKSERLIDSTWKFSRDSKNRPLLNLELKDFTGRVDGNFTPEEFRNPLHIAIRMHQLWGKLLSIQTSELLASIRDHGD